MKYYVPKGGLPAQTTQSKDKSLFTNSYAIIAKNALTDIVTSQLPFWERTRSWILAKPLSGFAETFAQLIVEVAPGGGSEYPEPNTNAQSALFVLNGEIKLRINNNVHILSKGHFVYIAPNTKWKIQNETHSNVTFQWIRKSYQRVDGLDSPNSFIAHDDEITPTVMEGSNGLWSTTRFIDPEDMRFDMHVNIVNFEPGGLIPFDETHVMEHGLYVLSGKADYRLNTDWHEVEAGDFMWLRAFCPQSCIAKGSGPFRYLLYKDVNRHPKLELK